jgi:hypothetical protein
VSEDRRDEEIPECEIVEFGFAVWEDLGTPRLAWQWFTNTWEDEKAYI